MDDTSEHSDDDDFTLPHSQMKRDEQAKKMSYLLDYMDSLDGAMETDDCREFTSWMDQMEQLQTESMEDPLKLPLVCYYNPVVGSSRQLMASVRDCLLNHRWLDAGKLMVELMLEPMCQPITMWRCNCEIMWQLREDLRGEMERFAKQMKEMKSLPKEFMTMEHTVFLLTDGKTDEANELLQGCVIKSSDKTSNYLSSLFRAYKGMFAYMEWKTIGRQLKGEQDEGNLVRPCQRRDDLARRACLNFESLKSSKLYTKIFSDKHDEILSESKT